MSERKDLTGSPAPVENRGKDPAEIPEEGATIIQSHDLLKGRSEVWIEHLGEMYRLRVTSRGKLYLTK